MVNMLSKESSENPEKRPTVDMSIFQEEEGARPRTVHYLQHKDAFRLLGIPRRVLDARSR